MIITVEAVVENGLLRPMQPLPLKENDQVRITIEAKGNWVQESYGLCGWKGNSEELQRLALAPTLDLEEEP
jgi:predicted DNA-binding antitoxin AbrB/MazE fold protein